MHYGTVSEALRALWPGVDPHDVSSTLCEAKDPTLQAVLDEALAMSGPDAASHLMRPVAATLEGRRPHETKEPFNALDALIRAGGDPTPILPIVAAALAHWRTTHGAAGVLRRAALAGWSLLEVSEPILTWEGETAPDRVAQLQRFVALQARGEAVTMAGLARVYAAQRIGNLFGGFGVLEAHLLSADVEAARDTLVAVEHAGSDLFRVWLALVPTLEHQLRNGSPPVQQEAARAAAQVHYAFGKADGRTHAEELEAFAARVGALIDALSGVLASEDAGVAQAAANAVHALVGHGASLEPGVYAVERALDDERVDVRIGCSRALSAWLLRTGKEPALPATCSHRRVFAASDDPLPGEGFLACPACGARAAVIYRRDDIRQFEADVWIEARCPGCGVYSEHHHGWG